MAESSEDFREALLNIARQARSLVDNFNDGNVQPIEQRMLSQRHHETGVFDANTIKSDRKCKYGKHTSQNSVKKFISDYW